MRKKEDRHQLIKKLLTTLHLNVVDRQIFKDNPIDIKEVKAIIFQSLCDTKMFPPGTSVWSKGQPVYEGYFIERVSDGNYILHVQRSYPIHPFVLAEKQEHVFDNFDKLVDVYIKGEYNYTIDGLTIKNGS